MNKSQPVVVGHDTGDFQVIYDFWKDFYAIHGLLDIMPSNVKVPVYRFHSCKDVLKMYTFAHLSHLWGECTLFSVAYSTMRTIVGFHWLT